MPCCSCQLALRFVPFFYNYWPLSSVTLLYSGEYKILIIYSVAHLMTKTKCRFTSQFKDEYKIPRGSAIDLSRERDHILRTTSKILTSHFVFLNATRMVQFPSCYIDNVSEVTLLAVVSLNNKFM